MASRIKKLRPEEWVILAFIIFLLAVRISVNSPANWSRIAVEFGLDAVMWLLSILIVFWILYAVETLYLAVVRRDIKSPTYFLKDVRYPRDFLPFLMLSSIFFGLGGGSSMTKLIVKKDMTYLLSGMDQQLFGCQASIAMQDFVRPYLTDLMSFLYSLHAFLAVALAVFLYRRHESKGFRNLMLAVVLSSIVSYFIFMLLPSASPVYVLDYRVGLDGSILTKTVDYAISALRSASEDCCLFPSLHVAISAIVLFESYRLRDKRIFYLLLPFIIGSWFSTVYLRRHYVVDAMGGFVLAAFCLYVSPRINDWWYKTNGSGFS